MHEPGAHRPKARSWLLAALTAGLAAAIYAAEYFVDLQIYGARTAIPVLYVAVVLLAVRFLQPPGVALVAAGCAGLVLLRHATATSPDLRAVIHDDVNTAMIILVIGLTAALVIRGHAADKTIHERGNLLDLTYDAVFACRMDHAITYWNRGAEELYGWPAAEAVGRTTDEVLETMYPADLDDLEAELLRTGRWEGELVTHRRDGGKVFVSARWLLRRDERDNPVAILKTHTDITARKQAQQSLQEAEANLARLQRVMLVGEMTASIAHEINQPLTGVVANAGTALRWLSAQPPNVEEARHYLGLIQSDGRRASDVIGRIRGLFRRVPPSIGPLDLNETVAEVCAIVSSDLQRHAVLLRTLLDPNRPVVEADRVQVQQVILNLLMNAVEAMQDVNDRPRELELITGQTDASQVFVEVRDSGPGLDPLRLDAVFDSFYSTKPGGMGMGLSISRSIVEAHGGHLSAAPNQPHGAIFRLTLPIAAEQAHYEPDGATAHGLHRR